MTGPAATASRLSQEDRRGALVDVAAELLVAHGAAGVTMEAVAAAAGVSRPLVYKHFANRDELLVELYRRESDRFDERVRAAIAGLDGFEAIVRATVDAVLRAPAAQARVLAALVRAETTVDHLREEKKARREGNRSFFARLAAEELGLDRDRAEAAVAVYFTGLDSLIGWSRRRGGLDVDELRELYVTLVLGGLREVARSRKA